MTHHSKIRDDEEWGSHLAAEVFQRRPDVDPRRASCPPPALLRAFHANTLSPVLQRRVGDHLSRCAMCQTLGEAMEDMSGDLSMDEQARIRSRIDMQIAAPPRRVGRPSWWRLAAALAGFAIASVVVWQYRAVSPRDNSITAFHLEKPEVRLPDATTDLVWRGPADSAPVAELATALGPYRADNLGEAEKELAALVGRFPRDTHALFYLGVTRLLIVNRTGETSMDRYAEAIRALESARRFAAGDRELDQEASWYLALAFRLTGEHERAAEILDGLCRSGGSYAGRACAGRRELAERSAR